jgi:membrane protein YqaA with SNARE-associated domain
MYTFMHIFAHADAWAHTSHIGMGASIRSSTEYAHTRTHTVIHPSTRKHTQARASTRKHTQAHASTHSCVHEPLTRMPLLAYPHQRARATCALVVAYFPPIGAHICACARMCIRHSCTYVRTHPRTRTAIGHAHIGTRAHTPTHRRASMCMRTQKRAHTFARARRHADDAKRGLMLTIHDCAYAHAHTWAFPHQRALTYARMHECTYS